MNYNFYYNNYHFEVIKCDWQTDIQKHFVRVQVSEPYETYEFEALVEELSQQVIIEAWQKSKHINERHWSLD